MIYGSGTKNLPQGILPLLHYWYKNLTKYLSQWSHIHLCIINLIVKGIVSMTFLQNPANSINRKIRSMIFMIAEDQHHLTKICSEFWHSKMCPDSDIEKCWFYKEKCHYEQCYSCKYREGKHKVECLGTLSGMLFK